MKKRTKMNKMDEKVADLRKAGWVVVYGGTSIVVMKMGDRRCTVDHDGKAIEGNANEI